MEWVRWLGERLQRLVPAAPPSAADDGPTVYSVLAHASPALLLVLQAFRAYSVPVSRVYLTFDPGDGGFLARVRDLCTDGVTVDTTLGDTVGFDAVIDVFEERHPEHGTTLFVLDEFVADEPGEAVQLTQDQLTFGADLYARGCVTQLYEWTLEHMTRRGRAFSARFPQRLPLDVEETSQTRDYHLLVCVYLDVTRGASDELIPVGMIMAYLQAVNAIDDDTESVVSVLRRLHEFQISTD